MVSLGCRFAQPPTPGAGAGTGAGTGHSSPVVTSMIRGSKYRAAARRRRISRRDAGVPRHARARARFRAPMTLTYETTSPHPAFGHLLPPSRAEGHKSRCSGLLLLAPLAGCGWGGAPGEGG